MPSPCNCKRANAAFFKAYGNFVSACPKATPLGTGTQPNNGCPQVAVGMGTTTGAVVGTWAVGNEGVQFQNPLAQKLAEQKFFAGGPAQTVCAGAAPPASNNGTCAGIS